MSGRCIRSALILSAILWTIIISAFCFANPYVVCDPYLVADDIINFIVIMDVGCTQSIYDSPAEVMTDGKTRLNYDIDYTTIGTHIMAVAAVNGLGLTSEYSYLMFTKACTCTECTYK